MTEDKAYYSKLLLFGEYSVMCDSMGLTVPLSMFTARWRFPDTPPPIGAEAIDSNSELTRFYSFLTGLNKKGELLVDLNLNGFGSDIKQGLYFNSVIPQGFGVGSSGALCAAVYERYSIDVEDICPGNEHLLIGLKNKLAQMESFFHGVSSGLDPLLCYLQKPLLIKNKQEIGFANLPEELHFNDFSVFLINTGVTGKTGPLVNRFFDQCRQHHFYSRFVNELIPANNRCIEAIVDQDTTLLFENLALLSSFFLRHFAPMIPESYRPAWQNGLDTGDYYLKLCGSGGGGFLLGFTKNLRAVNRYFNASGMEVIHL
ncbi:MAG: mevalonate kinase [Bacteroidetes bacterium CG18_big_fil_WC_8_21_14_2_50_41_14]|nr:MAG: mevalonate kinase [Bacteroidetes bacterium CG18_big_fil_WC_8_21_14_2_50_41_14]PJB54831.1 MAG: mevalonate kinase [Bacteroidetes bacterium CG_4_9_14_3_um_filter_41_19]